MFDISKLQNKRFALVYGQSIEGCGVSKSGKEMQLWCDKNNVPLTIYSYDERIYFRRDVHKMNFKSFMREDIPQIVAELNTYDVVMFNSYPSAKFPHNSIIDFYNELIKKVTTTKVGFMNELNKTNIDKIPYLVGIMNHMDLIYNFGESTWFSQTISKILPSKVVGKRVKKFTMWFNFDQLEKYRIPLNEKERKLLYLGRWTTMKAPRRVLDIDPILRKLDSNFKCEIMGIERSVGASQDVLNHPNCIDHTWPKKPPSWVTPEAMVHVYPSYNYDEGMTNLSKSLFGCSFYRMPKNPGDYGDRMENTQIEIIGVGSIPVFDVNWGENNYTLDGRRYIDIPNFAIFSNGDDLQDTANQIIEVANNESLQQTYIETSYEITKKEFDADWVIPTMFEYTLNVGVDDNKFKTDYDLIHGVLKQNNADEFYDLYQTYSHLGVIPVMGIRELYTHNIFSIIQGKKEEVIKIFK